MTLLFGFLFKIFKKKQVLLFYSLVLMYLKKMFVFPTNWGDIFFLFSFCFFFSSFSLLLWFFKSFCVWNNPFYFLFFFEISLLILFSRHLSSLFSFDHFSLHLFVHHLVRLSPYSFLSFLHSSFISLSPWFSFFVFSFSWFLFFSPSPFLRLFFLF